MSKRENHSLIVRPAGAVEKAAPGAMRILSGIVADTLALAKKETSRKSPPPRIVQVNDEACVNEVFDIVIRDRFPEATVLSFDNAAAAFEELSQGEPDLLITDDMMAGMCGSELCQRLLDMKVTYPIIVNSGWDQTEQWVREFAGRGLNVSFLPVPCDATSLRNLVEAALKVRREGLEKPVAIAPQPRRTRPLRIVMLDDEPLFLDATKMLLQYAYNDAKILTFTDAEEALLELTREDPDLLTTDWNHSGRLHGDGLFQLLAARKVRYPIFLMSAMIEYFRTTESLREYTDQGLNITFLPKPFTLEGLRPMLLKHFGPGDNPEFAKGEP